MSTFVSPLNKGITCNMSQLVTKQSVKITVMVIQVYTINMVGQVSTSIITITTTMTTTTGVTNQ